MKRYILLIVILILSFGIASAGDPEKEKAGLAAAEAWLKLVDGENYKGSWKEAAAFFKNAVTQDQWERTLEALRKPLGRTLSRQLKSKQFTTALPGAPDGEYVVIEFQTSFQKKKSANETVTPMKDPDGKWRVSGYYFK
jgi:Protein of unknown function (DUF4019)